jgi:hypothetical protein
VARPFAWCLWSLCGANVDPARIEPMGSQGASSASRKAEARASPRPWQAGMLPKRSRKPQDGFCRFRLGRCPLARERPSWGSPARSRGHQTRQWGSMGAIEASKGAFGRQDERAEPSSWTSPRPGRGLVVLVERSSWSSARRGNRLARRGNWLRAPRKRFFPCLFKRFEGFSLGPAPCLSCLLRVFSRT